MPTARVLVIDGDCAIREVLVDVLTDEGYQVVAVPDGVTALALVAPAPKVILLDAPTPWNDGSAFVRAYRNRPGGHAPIILMSTGTAAGASAAAGADGVLEKPFDLAMLFDLVARHAA